MLGLECHKSYTFSKSCKCGCNLVTIIVFHQCFFLESEFRCLYKQSPGRLRVISVTLLSSRYDPLPPRRVLTKKGQFTRASRDKFHE